MKLKGLAIQLTRQLYLIMAGIAVLNFAGCEDDASGEDLIGIWQQSEVDVWEITLRVDDDGTWQSIDYDFVNSQCFEESGFWSAEGDSLIVSFTESGQEIELVYGFRFEDGDLLINDPIEQTEDRYSPVSVFPDCADYGNTVVDSELAGIWYRSESDEEEFIELFASGEWERTEIHHLEEACEEYTGWWLADADSIYVTPEDGSNPFAVAWQLSGSELTVSNSDGTEYYSRVDERFDCSHYGYISTNDLWNGSWGMVLDGIEVEFTGEFQLSEDSGWLYIHSLGYPALMILLTDDDPGVYNLGTSDGGNTLYYFPTAQEEEESNGYITLDGVAEVIMTLIDYTEFSFVASFRGEVMDGNLENRSIESGQIILYR